MELLLFILAMSIWAFVYWPFCLVLQFFSVSRVRAIAIAVFWPVTLPLVVLYLIALSFLLRGAKF